MEYLNNFKIISGNQNSTALMKSKDILIPVQHLNAVKIVVTAILCVELGIEIQSISPKESSLLDNVHKLDH